MDKAARKRIGILLVSDDIGVVYYLLSIVKSLNFLPDDEKPELVILYESNCEKYIGQFVYDYISKVAINYNSNKKGKYLLSLLMRTNLFVNSIIRQNGLDGIFPLMDAPVRPNVKGCKVASWIPDFQHKFYPEFFTKQNLLLRDTRFKKILYNCDYVFLSSENAHGHLKQFYRIPASGSQIRVMPFVSMINDFQLPDFADIEKKYKINTPFFLVSNQFYAHKNHIAVLKAAKKLKDEGLSFRIYMTGKTEDYRNPQFFGTLTSFIEENKLGDMVQILGLIPREDQLALLKGSLAVIQPSKFEGWSTIIEDAKTFQVQVICSSIDVHQEQMGERAFYFEPDNADELADTIRHFVLKTAEPKTVFNNYEQRIQQFAGTFVSVF